MDAPHKMKGVMRVGGGRKCILMLLVSVICDMCFLHIKMDFEFRAPLFQHIQFVSCYWTGIFFFSLV